MSQVRDDKMKSFLKERLDGYEYPVKDELWASIESRLPASSPKRPLTLFRIIAAVSGIAAIFALSLLFSHKYLPQPETELLTAEKQTTIIEPNISENHSPITKPTTINNLVATISSATKSTELPQTETKAVETITAQTETTDTTSDTALTMSENSPEPQRSNDFRSDETARDEDYYWATWQTEYTTTKKDRNNFSIAFGVNGSNSDNSYDMKQRVIFVGHTGEEEIRTTLETDTKYDFPITAGVMFRYNLTQRFSLESGVNYTLLGANDKYTENGILEWECSYELQYLGIPLRASYAIYDNRRFSVYASAGVMAENLISGKSEKVDIDGVRETKDITTDNLLWSVSGAIGFNYKIGRTFGLFIEPSVGYYFDDGVSAPTIRRDRPLNFNLLFGIRINLN